MNFVNLSVDTNQLPKVEEVTLLPIDKNYLKVLRIRWVIAMLVVAITLSFFIYFIPFLQPIFIILIAAASLLVLATLSYILQIKSFHTKKYALRERDIIYKAGWLVEKTKTCPFNRIQNSSVSSGPIERRYGLAKLILYTTGNVLRCLFPSLLISEDAW
jgi:membrane protein YdbS with pleckstrin-like domain